MAAPSDDLRMYIVVNMTAKMAKGKTAAQVGHAVMLATEHLVRADPRLYARYKREGMTKVVLGAPAETMAELEAMPGAFAVRDAGRTQVAEGTLTAVAFAPMTGEGRSHGVLRDLKLL